jgi:hypothetical protein|mmetsp:Transcript_1643/g.2987  ORF Transcript_1643/g.2987 Transcript_1643/m.2987 type:complete len:95 (+) Transcript_1643:495-779(+)
MSELVFSASHLCLPVHTYIAWKKRDGSHEAAPLTLSPPLLHSKRQVDIRAIVLQQVALSSNTAEVCCGSRSGHAGREALRGSHSRRLPQSIVGT